MNKLNPHILLVMRWLQNPASISVKELEDNFDSATNVYKSASATAYYAVYDAAAAAASRACFAATYATRGYYFKRTKEHLNKYFELTKEDRTAYENRVKYLNILN